MMEGTRQSLAQAVEDARRYDGGYSAGNLCRDGDRYFFTSASETFTPAVMLDLWGTVEWMDATWPDNPELALDWLEDELAERGL
jgi:hypothetical protein